MLSEEDKVSIEKIARRYRVGRVLLFGSSVEDRGEAGDIELGVEGLEPIAVLLVLRYADLIFSLSKPVDVVDLTRNSRFTDTIRREGVAIDG